MLVGAGFDEAAFHGWTGYHTSPFTQGALVSARKPPPFTRPPSWKV
jgi:hypothetical protein